MKRHLKAILLLSALLLLLVGCGNNESFRTHKVNGEVSFSYRQFTPKSGKNMPLVIAFHGYGDTDNINSCRTASAWAEPGNQASRPCYVIAPVMENNIYLAQTEREAVYKKLMEIADSMVASGKVDGDRIYVAGNSFGGLATVEFAEMFPEKVAGALVMCPALTYSADSTKNLKDMTKVPAWFLQATNDNVIPITVSRSAVSTLEALGAVEVKLTEFSDEEMKAVGAAYGYHQADLAVMADETFMNWLFEKRKSH